jgi:hypothetical protein
MRRLNVSDNGLLSSQEFSRRGPLKLGTIPDQWELCLNVSPEQETGRVC